MAAGDDQGGFSWNLTPREPDPDAPTEAAATTPPAAPPAAEPASLNPWEALVLEAGQPTAAISPLAELTVADEDIETQEMSMHRPAYVAHPPYEPDFPAHALEQGEPPAVDSALPGASTALAAQPLSLGAPDTDSNALDSLFAAEQFVEYEEQPLVPVEVAPRAPKVPTHPLSPVQKRLIWVAGGLLAVILLLSFFLLGRQAAPPAAAPQPTPEPTASTSAAPVAEGIGPIAAGEYGYNELLGTECLEPFDSAWAATFTVVDCSTPHAAQLVYRGTFTSGAEEAFPGVERLTDKVLDKCGKAQIIDFGEAVEFTDIQLTASFAANEEEWAAGDRTYFCFATRSSGEKLTKNIAQPDVATNPTD